MKNKKTLIALIALVLLVVSAAAAWYTLKPDSAEGEKTLYVTVQHLNGDKQEFVIKTDAEYLRGALEPAGIISGTEEAYGLWIKTVDGETADESKQQWWGFNINGEMAAYGADTQPVYDGDVIDFILNEGY